MKTIAHQVGHLPATEEERRDQGGNGDDFGEFSGKEHEELAAGIFNVRAGH
jgi:hypothetical protein